MVFWVVDAILKDQPTLQDCQQFHEWLDAEKGFSHALPYNVMLLVEEVGEVAKEIRRMEYALNGSGGEQAIAAARERLRDELADCLAYIVKLANYTDIDLERAYVQKMRDNISREWTE